MKTTNKTIALVSLIAVRNVRISNDGRHLVPSILAEGMQERPWVTPIGDTGEYEIIRGHCRIDATGIIEREYPEDFTRLFKNGVKCKVITEVSANEVDKLKIDFNRRNLDNKYEIHLAANLLFGAGASEAEVVAELFPMLGGLTGARKEKVEGYKAELEGCENIVDRINLQKAIDEELFAAKRGKVQALHAVFTCPNIVMDCLYKKYAGTMPAHYPEGSTLPDLTQKQVKDLAKAHKTDCEMYENKEISERPTKAKPGSKFLEAFEAITREREKDEKPEGPRKSMPRKDILKPTEDGSLDSDTMCQLVKYHAGDKDVSGTIVKDVDYILAVVEVLKKRDLSAWEAAEEMYEEYLVETRPAPVADAEEEATETE